MIRRTVYFDEETALVLKRLAETKGRSQADIIREAVKAYVMLAEGKRKRSLPSGAGRYRSGVTMFLKKPKNSCADQLDDFGRRFRCRF